MPRIKPVDVATTSRESAEHLETTRKMFGATPNMFLTAANSPAAINAMNGLFASVGKSSFGSRNGELLAVAVAVSNSCNYCLAAHTTIGQSLGVSAAALAAARSAQSTDQRMSAALKLAVAINASRGHIGDAVLAEARDAGLTDAEVVEVVAHVALNVLTNYLNNVAETTIDFPRVTAAIAA